MDREQLYRFFKGCASVEEMKEIKEWSDSSDDNRRTLLRERKLFDALQLLDFTSHREGRKVTHRPLVFRLRRSLREVLKTAAVIAATVCVTALWFSIGNDGDTHMAMQTVTVPPGQRANVTLPDGSNVWLNAGSTLSYPVTFAHDKRQVNLEGEAYFDVTHNESLPFKVNAGSMEIEVLGTEFNVEADAQRGNFETSLIRGCVKVSSLADPSRHVTLVPSQKTRMEDGKFIVESIEDYDVYRWREGLYCFRNKPLSDIMKDLERYFDIEIRLDNPRIANVALTGKFHIPEGLEYILRVLQLNVKFNYRRDAEQNILYIN